MEVHEVVISGMSGRFPGCDTVEELMEFLNTKVNLVSEEGKWEPGELNVPHQVGKLIDPFLFDLTYFGIHRKLGEYMDPNVKLILENSIAAIHDAGLTLDDVAGDEIATVVGSSLVETEYEVIINNHRMDQNILSHSVCMQANRLAYFLDLKGPSYVCDSGFNGAMSGLRHARNLIARGIVRGALVSGSSVLFLPQISYHYHQLGRLCPDGKTKCFSNDADGYSRSEACVVFFLQRKEEALRNYGTLLGVDVTQNGSREGSLSDCSSLRPTLLEKFYKDHKIDPSSISYLEAAGCASKIVDARELNMVSEVLLPNRQEPLLIGSVKSNLGHTEAAAGFVGMVKAILSAEQDHIPPNLHYDGPNQMVPALVQGQMKVVTELTPLEGDLMAVNHISSVGGFSHVVLRKNLKSKKRKCKIGELPPDGLPRIVFLSARELDSLNRIIDKVEKMPIDEEFIALVNRAFGKGIKRHNFRGFTVLHDLNTTQKFRQVQEYDGGARRPLWFVFAGMGSQWPGMAADLMLIPTFAQSIRHCHKLLEPFGMDLINIVTNPHPDMFNDILNCFVGIAAVQVALIDVLKEVGLEADGLVGHSLGELGCAYADNSFTAEQMVMGAYYRGKVSAESGISDGLMAAVGKSYQFMKSRVPEGIDIACRNSSTSCTISGPAELVRSFMAELSKEGVFVRSVPSGNIAYHSRYIQSLGPGFLQALAKLVPEPKPRSAKWISSSVPQSAWESEAARYSSAQYHTNNLLSPVLFEEAIAHIPKEAIILEIAPRGLLQAIIKRAIPTATYISLTAKEENGHLHLLNSFGKLYNAGVHVNVEKLYPRIEFPVSRGTPSLTGLVTWIHNESWSDFAFLQKPKELLTVRDLHFSKDSKFEDFQNYRIFNNSIIPSAVFLENIIDMIKKVNDEPMRYLLMENVAFKRILKYGVNSPVRLALQEGSGNWEASLGKEKVANGRIQLVPYIKESDKLRPQHFPSDYLNSEEIYIYLEEMGLSLPEDMKLIKKLTINEDGTSADAEIVWNCDWLSFLDSIFVLMAFTNSHFKNELYVVRNITQIFMDLDCFSFEEQKVITVNYNKTVGILWADGLEILHPLLNEVHFDAAANRKRELHVPKFLAYDNFGEGVDNLAKFLELCTKMILNDIPKHKLRIFTLGEDLDKQKEFHSMFMNNFEENELEVTPLLDDSTLYSVYNSNLQNDYTLIVNNGIELENTLKILNTSRGGYLFCRNITSSTSLTYVLSKEIGKNTYYLYKTIRSGKANTDSVLTSNPKWREELQIKLERAEGDILYLASYFTSLNHVHELVQQCASMKNSLSLRFVFLESHFDKFRPECFKEHLKKDLRINILKSGKWGTYIFQPMGLSTMPKQHSLSKRTPVYQFRNIMKMSNLHVKALGLNMTGFMEDSRKLGIFEFSGEAEGQSVCGFAHMNERTNTLERDPIFVWKKPNGWSHEDISAVLLIYSIAYYIVEMECLGSTEPVESLLVLNGELPLSQAVIRLALRRGWEVYTTYDEVWSRREAIAAAFPQIDESHIIKGDKRLDTVINILTNKKGIDVVVNASSNPEMLFPALNILKKFSKFFHISGQEVALGNYIGLRLFIKTVSGFGVGPETLLKLSLNEKQKLYKLVEEGLKSGEIQTIQKQLLPASIFNLEAIQKMRDDYVLNEKFVVTTEEIRTIENKECIYQCSADKLYMIIGRENRIWFDLIGWLMSRGGRKFTIMVDNISPLLAKRLSVILMTNKSIQINLYSIKKLRSIGVANNFRGKAEENVKIGAAFVFGKEHYDILGELSNDVNAMRIILFGEDAEMRVNGLPQKPLFIEMSNNQQDSNIILKNLDPLMLTGESVVYVKEFPLNRPSMERSGLTHWEHLPDSVSALTALGRSADLGSSSSRSGSSSELWREVRSSSPRQSANRELPPVFLLPPLRPGQLDSLVSALFHPVFVARLPKSLTSLHQLAAQLYQGLEKFDQGVFTIICSDWCYNLGLALGKLLESHDKVISLVFLDVNTSWSSLGVLESIKTKARKELSQNKMENNSNKLMSLLERGTEVLKERLETVTHSTLPPSPLIKGHGHVFKRKNSSDDFTHINEHFEKPVKIHSVDQEGFLEFINSPDIVRIINQISIVENKDSAYKVTKDYETHKIVKTASSADSQGE